MDEIWQISLVLSGLKKGHLTKTLIYDEKSILDSMNSQAIYPVGWARCLLHPVDRRRFCCFARVAIRMAEFKR